MWLKCAKVSKYCWGQKFQAMHHWAIKHLDCSAAWECLTSSDLFLQFRLEDSGNKSHVSMCMKSWKWSDRCSLYSRGNSDSVQIAGFHKCIHIQTWKYQSRCGREACRLSEDLDKSVPNQTKRDWARAVCHSLHWAETPPALFIDTPLRSVFERSFLSFSTPLISCLSVRCLLSHWKRVYGCF